MNILVVDDEASLLLLLAQHLVRKGYTVLTAASVTEARTLIAKPPPFDFALIDWTLPDGRGIDVAQEILASDDKTRIIFSSGYPVDIGVVAPSLRHRVRVLQKPFLPRALAEVLTAWDTAS